MKSAFFKRILAMVMMAMLLTGDLIPSLADTVSDGDVVVVDVPAEDDGQNVDSEVTEDDTVNTNDSVETKETVEEDTTEEDTTEAENTEEDTEEVVEEVSVSDGEAEIEELEENTVVTLEPVTVGGVTITVSGSAAAFEEGTTVSAVAVEPAEVVIEAAEENEQATVKRYKAFDINLVCNGEIVQPLNGEEITVNFEGDMLIPDTDNEEAVAVYHVAENDSVTKMDAEVVDAQDDTTETAAVEMITTHFSTYMILVTGEEDTKYTVTVEHHLQGEDERLFIDSVYPDVEKGDKIFDFIKGEEYYEVVDVQGMTGNAEVSEIADGEYQVEVNGDATIVVYYSELTGTMRNGATMFDYVNDVATNPDSINYYENYGYTEQTYNDMVDKTAGSKATIENYRAADNWTDMNNWFMTNWNNAKNSDAYALENGMVMSTMGAHQGYQLHVPVYVDANNVPVKNDNGVAVIIDANDYNRQIEWTWDKGVIGFNRTDYHIVKDLLNGVKDDDGDGFYETVDFAFPDPGFFTGETKAGKTILEGYSLEFDRKGVTYTLRNVYDGSNNRVFTGIGMNENFFPLDSINNGNKNDYFGMRYDFEFSITDYVGDMTYKFSGDDDLWVCLDGSNVILDLGGVHDPYPGDAQNSLDYAPSSVDVWSVLLNKTNYTEQDKIDYVTAHKGESHTITVLFMERGGSASNCYMEFAMPDITSKEPVITRVPKANFEIIKKDSKNKEVIANVGFTLYSDAACTQAIGNEVFTGENGKVQFNGLKAGTYYLKETTYDATSYEANNTVYTVVVTADDTTATAVLQGAEKDGNAYVVYNTPIKEIDLVFQKVEHGNLEKKLVGAEFVLTSENDASFKMTAVSGENGMFTFEGIREGVYYLTETKAPEGYVLPNDSWVIRVSAFEGVDSENYWGHGTVYDEEAGLQYKINGAEGPTGLWQSCQGDGFMYIKNDLPASFEFTKIDAATKAPMKDVEFTLYSDLSAEMTAKVATAVSGADGKVVFENLADGNYLLVESPVKGYVAAGPWILSVVNNDGKYTLTLYDAEYIEAIGGYAIVQGSAYETMVIENTPEIGSLVITKTVDEVNMVHGEATFTFKIEGPEGEVLYRTITFDEEITNGASKSVTISNLPIGTYKVTELETLRYKCVNNAVQSKAVVVNQTTNFEFYNEKVFDNYYSHSDVKVNVVTFERDADGNIIGSNISQKITSDNN